mmetsp:Transcript_106756/g.300076  ORF Transcript_106756/g.300076 Transcript_106756/m.300076 type:complete len:247 (+) Transcript_106756:715-1455(+)
MIFKSDSTCPRLPERRSNFFSTFIPRHSNSTPPWPATSQPSPRGPNVSPTRNVEFSDNFSKTSSPGISLSVLGMLNGSLSSSSARASFHPRFFANIFPSSPGGAGRQKRTTWMLPSRTQYHLFSGKIKRPSGICRVLNSEMRRMTTAAVIDDMLGRLRRKRMKLTLSTSDTTSSGCPQHRDTSTDTQCLWSPSAGTGRAMLSWTSSQLSARFAIMMRGRSGAWQHCRTNSKSAQTSAPRTDCTAPA